MDTVGEYFINNDIGRIIKYLYICACPSGMLMVLGVV